MGRVGVGDGERRHQLGGGWNVLCKCEARAGSYVRSAAVGVRAMSKTKVAREHPQEAHPQPTFPDQEQEFPGKEKHMAPKADHGEKSYRGTGRLKDMKAIITGADSGIGRAVAIAFAREGADVLISYFNEDDDAAETARWVEDAGRKAVRLGGDIGDEEHCKRIV